MGQAAPRMTRRSPSAEPAGLRGGVGAFAEPVAAPLEDVVGHTQAAARGCIGEPAAGGSMDLTRTYTEFTPLAAANRLPQGKSRPSVPQDARSPRRLGGQRQVGPPAVCLGALPVPFTMVWSGFQPHWGSGHGCAGGLAGPTVLRCGAVRARDPVPFQIHGVPGDLAAESGADQRGDLSRDAASAVLSSTRLNTGAIYSRVEPMMNSPADTSPSPCHRPGPPHVSCVGGGGRRGRAGAAGKEAGGGSSGEAARRRGGGRR